jgi:hypothetical protein
MSLTLTGRVLADSLPQAGSRVLAIDAARLLAHADTRADGSFALALPDGTATVTLFAMVRGSAIGVVHRAVELPAAAEVVLALERVWPLTVRAEGDVPEGLRLRLEPVRAAGVPDALLHWIHASVDEMTEAQLAIAAFDGTEARVAVQEGRWRLSAELDLDVDALTQGMTPARWYTTGARLPSGERLEAPELDVAGPASVILEIARVPINP